MKYIFPVSVGTKKGGIMLAAEHGKFHGGNFS
jgi:hypothetical protein